jgi:hypothetical protein
VTPEEERALRIFRSVRSEPLPLAERFERALQLREAAIDLRDTGDALRREHEGGPLPARVGQRLDAYTRTAARLEAKASAAIAEIQALADAEDGAS